MSSCVYVGGMSCVCGGGYVVCVCVCVIENQWWFIYESVSWWFGERNR